MIMNASFWISILAFLVLESRTVDGIHYNVEKCEQNPGGFGTSFDTEHSAYCVLPCLYAKEVEIWGSRIYTYDSSLCKSALHDNRISYWNRTQRHVTFIRRGTDPERYYGSYQQGVRSSDYSRLSNFRAGHFFFTSPKIQEPLRDVTSVSRGFLRENENDNVLQECHLGSNVKLESVTFQYYLTDYNFHLGRISSPSVPTGMQMQIESNVWVKATWKPEPSGYFYPGGLWCILNKSTYSQVLSLTMNRNAQFYPERWTVRTNVGETAYLRMRMLYPSGRTRLWQKDAGNFRPFDGQIREVDNLPYFDLVFNRATSGNRGIYSLHGSDFKTRGISRLIVRDCAADLYGTRCDLRCPPCQNGGVCHDIMGGCICPPGFNGSLCQHACGDNHYGSDCSLLCSDSNPKEAKTCRGLLFCLPDPFGCSCGAGFKGIDCNTPCSPGEFGSGCELRRDCRCNRNDQSCDRDTGLCPGDCQPSWKGQSCNISYPFLSAPPKLLPGTGPRMQQIQILPWDGVNGEGYPVAYIIEIKINETGKKNEFQEVMRMNYTDERQEWLITDLLPNTYYVVRIVLLDDDGQAQRIEAPFSVFRTSCGAPEGLPQDVVANFDSPKLVKITWNLPDSSKWNCDTVSVRIQYNVSGTSYSRTLTENTIQFNTDPYTFWMFKLRLETPNVQFGNWTQFFRGRTAEDAPDKVENLTVKYEPEARRLSLTWDPPRQLNGVLRYYLVKLMHLRWLHCDINPVDNTSSLNVTDLSAIFHNLLYSSIYRVSVLGFTVKLGMQQYNDTPTIEGVPSGPPENLESLQIRSRQFSVKWTQPNCEKTNGKITGYLYRVRGISPWDKTALNVSTTSASVGVQTFTPFTAYEFRVHACTLAGCGQNYSALNITTQSEAPPPPRDLTVYRTTMTSLSVSWQDPYPPYGIVTGFRIAFKVTRGYEKVVPAEHLPDFVCKEEERKEMYCYTIHQLSADKTYEIMVIAGNEKGYGSPATVEGITQESVPDPPENLNVSQRTTSSLFVVWDVPLRQNGNITGYQVNLTEVQQGQPPSLVTMWSLLPTHLNVTGLSPATLYNLSVAASTSKGYGPSTSRIFSTRSPEIEIKEIPKVGNILDNTVEVLIKPLNLTAVPMSVYFVLVKEVQLNEDKSRLKRCAEFSPSNRPKRCAEMLDDTVDNKRLLLDYNTSRAENSSAYAAGKLLPENVPQDGTTFLVGDGKHYNGYYNAPLETGHSYKIGLAVVSSFAEDPKSCVLYSEPITVKSPDAVSTSSPGLMVGIGILCFLGITAALLFLYYKKPHLFHSIKDKATFHIMFNKKEEGSAARNGLSESMSSLNLYADCESVQPVTDGRILVTDLEDFVKKAEASGKIIQEFRAISKSPRHPRETAHLPENKSKNRYGGLLPYDHSRVVLEKLPNDPFSDYINANYMNGYQAPRKYIATQGPKPLTVVDFWRMIWQENVCKIVMVTNVLEGGKVKCEKYWPDTTDRFGQLTIQLIDTTIFSDYVIRTFQVSMSEDRVRVVTQFHFTTWPDHCVPMYPMAIGGFLKRIRSHNAESKDPVVVHCSAGVGRTGTLILLDCMMDMALAEDAVDLPTHLAKLRQQRVNQIENADQYTFVYRTLAEVLCGVETSILCSDFFKEFQKLQAVDATTGKTQIQDHFERLERVGRPLKMSDCKAAVENFSKNRNQQIIPPDHCRPILPTPVSGNGGNYINAVFVNGYNHRDAFLATQFPLTETMEDFWRMIKSANIKTIVLLQAPDQVQYWPEVGDDPMSNAGSLTIEATSVENMGTELVVRSFTIKGPGTEEEVVVKQFHLQSWSTNRELPSSPDAILDLIEKIERWQKQTGNRPITVQCLDGASACGVFCAAVFVCDKIKAEQEVDVYLAVRSIRHNRPQFIKSLGQYLFCHQLALNYLEAFEIYANFQ